MNNESITIEKGRVTIRPRQGTVWLTQHQIADLFGVFVSAVNSNIRSILKNGVLREEKVCFREATAGGGRTLYNLEMITALAFRLKSLKAEQYRQWIIEQAVNPLVIWKIPGMEAMLN